jgi:hypothetical protein
VLDLCYEGAKAEILDVLRRTGVLMTNINQDGIINICILEKSVPFCIRFELVDVRISSAGRITEWLVKQLS